MKTVERTRFSVHVFSLKIRAFISRQKITLLHKCFSRLSSCSNCDITDRVAQDLNEARLKEVVLANESKQLLFGRPKKLKAASSNLASKSVVSLIHFSTEPKSTSKILCEDTKSVKDIPRWRLQKTQFWMMSFLTRKS